MDIIDTYNCHIQISILEPSRPNRLFLLEIAETPLRDFGDTGLIIMRHTNGGTILTQNPQKQKKP